MIRPHTFRPDLAYCALEDRCLPTVPGPLTPEFIVPLGPSVGFMVTGFGEADSFGDSGAVLLPRPRLPVPRRRHRSRRRGRAAGGVHHGGLGGFSIFGTYGGGTGLGRVSRLPGASLGVSVRNGTSLALNVGPTATPTVSPLSFAYGGSFNSGYNSGLNITNGYGMTETPLGSITPHLYDTESSLEDTSGQNDHNTVPGQTSRNQDAQPQGARTCKTRGQPPACKLRRTIKTRAGH